jgi:hypothetical protein
VPKPLEELGYEFLEALERHDADALVARIPDRISAYVTAGEGAVSRP